MFNPSTAAVIVTHTHALSLSLTHTRTHTHAQRRKQQNQAIHVQGISGLLTMAMVQLREIKMQEFRRN